MEGSACEIQIRIFGRSANQKDGLGLLCTEDGLFLAGTPLLERQAHTFVARRQTDLETVLSRGFGFPVSLDRVLGGLTTVASALNAGDLCRARIASVHLRIPGLPDGFARLDMQLDRTQRGAEALNQALSDVLENPSIEIRQWVLDNYEIYTRTDPAEVGHFSQDLLSGALLGITSDSPRPISPTAGAAAAEVAPSGQVAAEESIAATSEAASEFWRLGWAAWGLAIHDALKGNLPSWFKGIDDFSEGVATSFKTIDLNAGTYQDASQLGYRINTYVNKLANFRGAQYEKWEVSEDEITSRVLKLVIPKGSMSSGQRAAIDAAINRAKTRGIDVTVQEF